MSSGKQQKTQAALRRTYLLRENTNAKGNRVSAWAEAKKTRWAKEKEVRRRPVRWRYARKTGIGRSRGGHRGPETETTEEEGW